MSLWPHPADRFFQLQPVYTFLMKVLAKISLDAIGGFSSSYDERAKHFGTVTPETFPQHLRQIFP
jgi:hypothetical protein